MDPATSLHLSRPNNPPFSKSLRNNHPPVPAPSRLAQVGEQKQAQKQL